MTFIRGVVFTGITAGLGLWLGPKVGLGAPTLRAWLDGESGALRRIRAILPLAVVLGLGFAVVLGVAGVVVPLAPESLQQTAHPPAWQVMRM